MILKVKKDGFIVDTETGECIEEIYFPEYTDEDSRLGKIGGKVYEHGTRQARTEMRMSKFKNNSKWRRLNKIDQSRSRGELNDSMQKTYFREVMSEFHISEHQKKFLYKTVFVRKPRRQEDTMIYLFEAIQEYNIPIRTSEFIKATKEHCPTRCSIIHDRIYSIMRERDYTWVINDILSKLTTLSSEQKIRVFEITRKNFEILKKDFATPITLIGTLTRMAVLRFYKRGDYPPLEWFNVSESIFYQQRKKIKELIKNKS